MHSDLVRWGASIPFAGRLVSRMAETLLFAPGAGELVIEFHVNGASFFYGVERHDLGFERSDAARAAGSARFKVTLDLAAYREAVDSAFAIYGRPVGDDDAG
ncbi:hypothetical protein [Sphingomonas sp.]|uniref:hypothetical protein n=1 Tax=Sphingomonas sp. TaxID=28214 RepID=UPI002DD6B3C6|nr:hypothetical protein [Sphingomonas sp.]